MSMESGQLGGNGSVPSNNGKSRRPDLALLEKAVPQRPLLDTQKGNAPWEGQSGGSTGCEQAPHNRIQAWHTGLICVGTGCVQETRKHTYFGSEI